ncbi:hypothetical protein ACK280_23925 [Mycobacterium sherrisii]|uniref:hypothetical protein n=1 Tax=Mycobacterium sherrisii TaxID=243061 RepID=UPI0039765507
MLARPLMPSLALGSKNRYPIDWQAVTHGWRWYRVEGGKLLSPLQGYPLALPRNGLLPGAYFAPSAIRIWSMVLLLRQYRPYDFALTFGTVSGPFQLDPQMPKLGSMLATEYRAQVILSHGAADLDDSYDLPVVQQEIELDTLKRIEAAVLPTVNTS